MARGMFDRSRRYLEEKGLPARDNYELSTSPHRFPDGAHFRIEVPTVNSAAALNALFREAKQMGFVVNRVSITYGVMRYSDAEITEMLGLAGANGAEAFMMVGPRAPLDIGVQAHLNTLNAQHIGYRLRGMDQLMFGVEDALRAIDLGCRGIIVCDEGLLWTLDSMRTDGRVPASLRLKASVLLGTANPVHFRILAGLGADSINVQRDMPLPMIGAFRSASERPLDVHANNPGQTGGFVRTYEVPDMVRIAAPVYIKTGNIAVPLHSMMVDEGAGERMAREVNLTVEMIRRYFPTAVQTVAGASDLAMPEMAQSQPRVQVGRPVAIGAAD